jgi:hypothetical protein
MPLRFGSPSPSHARAKGAVKRTTAHRGNSAILRPGAYQRTRCIGTVGLRGGSLAAPRRPTGGIQLQLHSGATRRRPAVPAAVRVRRLGTAADSPGAQFSYTPPRRHRHGVLPYRRQRGFAGVHARSPPGGENRLTISAAQPLRRPVYRHRSAAADSETRPIIGSYRAWYLFLNAAFLCNPFHGTRASRRPATPRGLPRSTLRPSLLTRQHGPAWRRIVRVLARNPAH